MEQQDYFKVGTVEAPVISNSSLSAINPEQGGSPKAFKDFFIEKNEAEKSYYRMGSLMHKWAEDKENFAVSEIEKPTEKLGIVADAIIVEINNGSIWTDELGLEVARALRYQNNYKDETLKKHVFEGTSLYINEIVTARENNQIFLTKREADTVRNCVEAVEKHPTANGLLFGHDVEFSNKQVWSELEIYWSKFFVYGSGQFEKEILMEFKAKLDKLVIDHEKKLIIYVDPKTTSGGVYGFAKSFEGYRYYRQQAFYNWAIKEFFKQQGIDITGYSIVNYNIVIETSGLYQVGVFSINHFWLVRGQKEYQALVKRLVEHTATNQWSYSIEEINNNYILDIPFNEVSINN